MKQAGTPAGSNKGCVTGQVSRGDWWRHSLPASEVGTERTAVTIGEDSVQEKTKGKVPLGKEESLTVEEEGYCVEGWSR